VVSAPGGTGTIWATGSSKNPDPPDHLPDTRGSGSYENFFKQPAHIREHYDVYTVVTIRGGHGGRFTRTGGTIRGGVFYWYYDGGLCYYPPRINNLALKGGVLNPSLRIKKTSREKEVRKPGRQTENTVDV
jgi:hypothetical protein